MQWEVRAEPADISIHALHEESDTTANAMLRMLKFQSTLSMRRATDEHHHAGADDRISIHALHEESDYESRNLRSRSLISIHALHEESDLLVAKVFDNACISIHALHEESDPQFHITAQMLRRISIHALHEESDTIVKTQVFQGQIDFNPRSP